MEATRAATAVGRCQRTRSEFPDELPDTCLAALGQAVRVAA
ncbi:hypothetical protein D187_007667 [Cystobacter fuscus DSM 2262]|uniref:Uncharacterized protein n=1 Tax=Cystobacter fuscus (strain ATCC 25194 / DSM 2262 / NBRC 100088 / M29) TaxID=1242864 RepID=S9NVV5_CYSF2|nr:hypothetical protein D187_007667 [Cystobacter fuscus DSM 2262]